MKICSITWQLINCILGDLKAPSLEMLTVRYKILLTWHYNTEAEIQPKASTYSYFIKTSGCQVSTQTAEYNWGTCALRRDFFFQVASSNFSTVSVTFLVQTMTVSPLPAEWSQLFIWKCPEGELQKITLLPLWLYQGADPTGSWHIPASSSLKCPVYTKVKSTSI